MIAANIRSCLAIAALGLILAPVVAQSQSSSCNTSQPDFIQISSMQLDAGNQTFEDFKILSTDVVEWARWDSNGALLGHGVQRNAGQRDYERAHSSPSFSSSARATTQSNGAIGRPAFRMELAVVSKSRAQTSTMTTMPADIAALTSELRNRLAPGARVSGPHLWIRPFGAGQTDVDLTRQCSSGVARSLTQALNDGQLLVRADSAREFVSGERAGRIEFLAKTQAGVIRFGVVELK